MLQTNNNLRRTVADELQPGELFIYSFDSVTRSLIMRLFTTASGTRLYGVLDSPSFKNPFTFYTGDISGACLSYGTDWFLETTPGPETHGGATFHREQNHRLFLDRDNNLVLRFGAETRGFGTTLDYAIGDLKERQIDSTAAPIAAFKIWADKDAYLNPRGAPILSHPATGG